MRTDNTQEITKLKVKLSKRRTRTPLFPNRSNLFLSNSLPVKSSPEKSDNIENEEGIDSQSDASRKGMGRVFLLWR